MTAKPNALEPLHVEVSNVLAGGGGGREPTYPVVIARDREARLSARVGGVLNVFPVRIGDRRPRGALIGKIEATSYDAATTRAASEAGRLARSVERNVELFAIGAISRQQYDDTLSQFQAAQASLEIARYDARSTTITMPFSGTVLSVQAAVGETIAPGQTLATVADGSSALIAKAKVPQATVRRLRVGQAAEVSFSGLDRPLSAHIIRIGTVSDGRSATIEVDLSLAVDADLASGIIGSVRFAGAAAQASSAEQRVPVEALLDVKDGLGHVYLVAARTNTAQNVTVTVRGIDGDWLSLCCLPADARVITSGAGFVKDGQRVIVTTQ